MSDILMLKIISPNHCVRHIERNDRKCNAFISLGRKNNF